MKRTLFVLILILAGLMLAACAEVALQEQLSSQTKNDSYTDIGPEKLNEMLSQKDFLLINVHVPFDGDIPGTDNSIPYDQISNSLSQLPENRDSRIVVYCRSGSMSSIAAKELVSLGFTEVVNLDGGFNSWVNAGFPLDN
jgi:rhodanese-related sulfurtransferase